MSIIRGFIRWLAVSLVLAAGCASDNPPMPLGPGGPGSSTYSAAVTPNSASGTYTVIASTVHIGSTPSSPATTVHAYLKRGDSDYFRLPISLNECGGVTHYTYYTAEGQVTFCWQNTADAIPDAFEAWVVTNNPR